jgi:AcrR family transcriptional regulator
VTELAAGRRTSSHQVRKSVLAGAAAAELFAAGGSEVQMDEVAERAGLGMGTLCRHFLSFEDFILLTRGAMANMKPGEDWRRHVALVLDGIRAPRA